MTPTRQRALILGLIAVGILVVGFFGLRAFVALNQFREHRPPPFPEGAAQQVETDVELIRDWMTIPFISRMYAVPPSILFDAIDVSPRGNDEKSLAQLNAEFYSQADGIVMEKIKAAILANQPPAQP